MRVLFIAPYKGLAELVDSLQLDLQGYQVTTYVANLEESTNFIKSNEYSDNDFDIIISRGGTANKLRENTSLQVVEVEVSGYDILRLTTYLKNFDSRVGVVGFNNIISNFKSVSSLTDIDLYFKSIKQEKDVPNVLKELKNSDINIVVGDTVTIEKASQIEMEGILLTSGKESIYDAFKKAEVLYSETQKYKNEINIFTDILDCIDYPIVLFDSSYKIKYKNNFYSNNIFTESNTKVLNQLKILTKINDNLLINDLISINLIENIFQYNYKLKMQRLSDDFMNPLTLIEYKSDFTEEFQTKIKIWNTNYEEFKLFENNKDLLFTQNYTSLFSKYNCLTIIGEYGTGKKFLVNNILNKIDSLNCAIEIDFYDIETKLFNNILSYLQEIYSNSLIVISNIENLNSSQQKKFREFFIKHNLNIVFLFENTFELESLKLEKRLGDFIEKEMIYLPNLRQNEDIIVCFIINYIKYLNEKYGKQIVGVKNNDFTKFKSYSWPGNFIELKNTVDKLYEKSNDEYLLDMSKLPKDKQSTLVEKNPNYELINLNNSLFEIEKDIINKVYKKEKYNKTKTAKRLSINRSTLWRKLDN